MNNTLTVFGLIAAISAFIEIRAFGGLSEYINLGYGAQRYAILEENGLLGGGIVWLMLFLEIGAYYGFKTKQSCKAWLSIAGYLVLALLQIQIGGRSTIALTALVGACLYHYGYRRIPSRWVVAGLIGAASLSQFFSLSRAFLKQGIGTALVEGVAVAKGAPQLLLPWAGAEAKYPARSLIEILENGGPPLQWGKTYLGALIYIIPFVGRFTGTVFMNPNHWRMETFYPVVLADHGGLGFSPVTEGFMNFGWFGVCLALGLYGFLAGRIVRGFRSNQSCTMLLFLALSLPLFYLDGLRINSAAFLFKWLRFYLAPLVLLLILKAQSRPWTISSS